MTNHLLIVEDEDVIRGALQRTLERAGFTILEASSAEEAVAVALDNRATLRVVISDIVLPGVSGPQMAETLREVVPRARVILMSGHAREHVLPDSDRSQLFIQKPFSNDDIIALARWALSNS